MAVENPSDFPQVEPEQEEHEKHLAQMDKLQAFGAVLSRTRDNWVQSRATTGVDKRFSKDLDQYHGRDGLNNEAPAMMSTVAAGYPIMAANNQVRPTRSTIFVGVTRQKSNAGEARLSDVVLPSDDRNFGIDPTIKPDMKRGLANFDTATHPTTGQPMAGPDGQPMRMTDIAQAALKAAKEAADRMQDTIDDQLTECDFNGECRKMLHDCAVLGTGVMKGPVVVKRTYQSWEKATDATGQSVRTLTVKEELSPASFRVDPRNVFPDPACGDYIHNGAGIWEYSQMTPKQVRKLSEQPEYMDAQLELVLKEPPKTTTRFDLSRDTNNKDIATGDVYEHWEYWGEFKPDDLKDCGVAFNSEHDPLTPVAGVIELIGETVVRAYLNPSEDGALPYDFLPWERVADSPWGYGIPYLMRAQQQVINAGWRQMMDNAGISSGPQIVLKPGSIYPADKKWEIGNRKLWFAKDETEDVNKAFTTFSFDSRQGDLQNILKMAEALSDQETAVPSLEQGDKGGQAETVGGMQIRMNGANVVLRRLVKQWDDLFMKAHIRRYYNFNMAYNDDETIKGDFAVNPRGSTSLMIRDIQNQAFTNLLALGTNPAYAPMINLQKLFERALRAQHVDPTDIMRTEQEIAQAQQAAQQNQQPDPRILAAQVRAQADLEREKLRQEEGMASIEAKREAAQMDTNTRMQELYIERDIAMLRVSADQGISLDKIKAMLADTAIRERTKKEIAMGQQAHSLQLQGNQAGAQRALAQDNLVAQQYAKLKDHQHAHQMASMEQSEQARLGLLDAVNEMGHANNQRAHDQTMQTADQEHQQAMQDAQHSHEADQQASDLQAQQDLADSQPAPAQGKA